MARYIDANKIDYTATMVGQDEYAGYREIAFKSDIDELPAADVVPKSEVDLYKRQVDELEDELAQTYDKLETAKTEVESTEKRCKELEQIAEYQQNISVKRYFEIKRLEEDVERLEKENEVLKTNNNSMCQSMPNIAKAERVEVAREIFEEIEKEIDLNMSVIQKILNAKGGRANGKTVLISKYDVFIEAKKHLAELKKKYTEDNDESTFT